MSWTRKKSTFVSVAIILNLIALELFSFLVGKAGLLAVYQTPRTYEKILGGQQVSYVWWDERNKWGAWHQINKSAQHKTKCFDASYKSNEIGARDTKFSETKGLTSKLTLLGDSFAEGWGLNEEEAPQFRIEELTNFELYNFGSAGNVGPVQYWLIYRELARKYSSEGVIIFFYPDNDFLDNDYTYWSQSGLTFLPFSNKERFRPYYVKKTELKSNQTFEYFIPKNAIKRDNLASNSSSPVLNFIYENFWSGNLVKTLRSYWLKSRIAIQQGEIARTYSGYFDASREQQEAAMFFINRIVDESKEPVLLVSIPQKEDFNRISQGERASTTFWQKYLKDLEKKEKFRFIDLSEHVSSKPKELFFDCDTHWSPQGSKWAADIIAREVVKVFKKPQSE